MPEGESWIDQFVAHLEELRDQENRGALATLRRGVGSAPGAVVEMYPQILPWVPNARWAEDPAYIMGSLFALHPEPGGNGNMGTAFAKVENPSESLEKRVVALLNSHRDDLPNHLRQAVSLLKSKGIPINWRQLLRDILSWDHESRFVQRQWAREFWQGKV
jgi:CRISPR system Cascade subunit CasB